MSAKVLVADDSKTIQKVVGITLADTDYAVDQSLNEAELHQKLSTNDYALVLLDFNLSDAKSGYELVSEVKNISPNISVMLMLGTFDTLDEQRCREVGVDDEVIKPFESAKFIQKCKDLVEKAGQTSENVASVNGPPSEPTPKAQEAPQIPEEQPFSLEEGGGDFESDNGPTIGDDWVVDAPEVNKTSEVTNEINREDSHTPQQEHEASGTTHLNSEVEDWGMEVPNVIGEQISGEAEYPPIIEENNDLPPDQNDMDVMDDFPSASMEDLQETEGQDEDQSSYPSELEFELKEEVEKEITPEEFWAMDENGVENSVEKGEEGSTPNTGDFSASQAVAESSLKEEQIIEEIVNRVTPMIEKKLEEKIQKIIKESSAERIEKVAWEVIPDLAENLIKKEIKDISNSLEK